jgi:hypothetical protein
MGTVNPNKAGLVLGMLGGGWHVLWALLVAFDWAQSVINFVFWMHFIKPIYVIEPFHAGIALILIGVTAAIGYAIGYVFGLLWNWIHQ